MTKFPQWEVQLVVLFVEVIVILSLIFIEQLIVIQFLLIVELIVMVGGASTPALRCCQLNHVKTKLIRSKSNFVKFGAPIGSYT